MSRINGGGHVLLPQHEAAAVQQSRAAQAAYDAVRLETASQQLASILPTYIATYRARTLVAAGKSPDSLESVTFDFTPAIDAATNLAIATADMLLGKLGIVGG